MNEETKKRKGVFLVIVDGTEECTSAIDYAADFAIAEDGYVALLHVMESTVVQNWQNIEDKIKKELRENAEQAIWHAAGRVIEQTGKTPIAFIEEGDRSEIILKTIEDNSNIVALVLAAAANSSKPGSLVSYFSGKGLARLNVPLMIVPGIHD